MSRLRAIAHRLLLNIDIVSFSLLQSSINPSKKSMKVCTPSYFHAHSLFLDVQISPGLRICPVYPIGNPSKNTISLIRKWIARSSLILI